MVISILVFDFALLLASISNNIVYYSVNSSMIGYALYNRQVKCNWLFFPI